MSISSLGIGSGIDISSLVSQLVSAERSPQEALLSNRSSSANAELSALGRVRSSLGALKTAAENLTNADLFSATRASSGDEAALLVSSSNEAVAGSYDARVLQLASAHKLHSMAYADADTDVGYGDLTLSRGSDSFTVSIDSSSATLADIRDAINDAADNPGIQATIVTADDGARLILESTDTGAANNITVTAAPQAGGEGLNDLVYVAGGTENLTQLNNALDAQLSIDGFVRSSPTNQVTDAVDGLTFTLLAEDPATDISIDIQRDDSDISDAIDAYVKAYNNAQVTLSSVSVAVPGGTSGALVGDTLALGASQRLRSSMIQSFAGDIGALSAIGITLEVDGTMNFDSAELDAQLASNRDGVVALVAGDDGLGDVVSSYLDGLVGDDGIVESREEGVQGRLDRIEEQRERWDLRMERYEARLSAQFAAMDQIVASLQTTGSYLSQQLSALPGFTRSEQG